jgi:hypothetical protein
VAVDGTNLLDSRPGQAQARLRGDHPTWSSSEPTAEKHRRMLRSNWSTTDRRPGTGAIQVAGRRDVQV